MPSNPDVHALTGAYVTDALDPGERAAFEAHLAECDSCAAEVAELREATAALGFAAAETPPPGLRAAVNARIELTRQLPPNVEPTEVVDELAARRRRNPAAWIGWGVAAALAGIVIVLGAHTVGQQHRIDSANRQAAALSALLAAPDAHSDSAAVSGGGTATVLASRSHDEAVILAAGLAAPPPGHDYQLWMIGKSGIRSGGLLPALSHGASGPIIAHGLGDAETIGLTIEPAGGSAQPTTPPLLMLPMPS